MRPRRRRRGRALDAQRTSAHQTMASMRPRRRRRGRCARVLVAPPAAVGFNEASSSTTRKGGIPRASLLGMRCFNEASSSTTRKAILRQHPRHRPADEGFNEASSSTTRKDLGFDGLPGRHDCFNEASSSTTRKGADLQRHLALRRASMRPRRRRRGRSGPDPPRIRPGLSFNEASSSTTRKGVAQGAHAGQVFVASMRPRRRRRGRR